MARTIATVDFDGVVVSVTDRDAVRAHNISRAFAAASAAAHATTPSALLAVTARAQQQEQEQERRGTTRGGGSAALKRSKRGRALDALAAKAKLDGLLRTLQVRTCAKGVRLRCSLEFQ